MFIRFGYEIAIDCPQPTPMMTFLSVPKERRNAVVTERGRVASPLIPMEEITDPHHNICFAWFSLRVKPGSATTR
nr:hypothetical protein [Sinorhizobium fredii]